MLASASVVVSIIGLLIGFYQWRRLRGDVRLELHQLQVTVHLTVRTNTSAAIKVRGIRYEVRSRWPPLRSVFSLLSEIRSEEFSTLSQRLRFVGMMHGLIAVGRCEPVSVEPGDLKPRFAFPPIAGPTFPKSIDGYDDASWAFDVRHYVELFQSVQRHERYQPRLRFVAMISGHWRREVKSQWLDIRRMHAFAPENAWLFKDAAAWRVDNDGRTTVVLCDISQ